MYVIARPRIHVSLADMGFASQRMFGGIGFSIEKPLVVFEFEKASDTTVDGLEMLDEEGGADLLQIASQLKVPKKGMNFRAILREVPPQHVGFGTKTALALGLIAGANAFWEAGWSIEDMQRLSGRGAASGVGLYSFFKGGVIWDLGHRVGPKRVLLPSGAARAMELPLLGAHFKFPTDWHVVIALPSQNPISGKEEEEFFQRSAPVAESESLATIAILYHGVLPSIISKDYASLSLALAKLHCVGFKAKELDIWPDNIRETIRALSAAGFAAGISSVGPLVYVILPSNDSAIVERVRTLCSPIAPRIFMSLHGWNSGYEVHDGRWQ